MCMCVRCIDVCVYMCLDLCLDLCIFITDRFVKPLPQSRCQDTEQLCQLFLTSPRSSDFCKGDQKKPQLRNFF